MRQLLGYARVSTGQQTLDQQTDALTAAGVETQHIYSDVMSGAIDDRPGLKALMEYAREGDVIVVVALDRLGRSLSGVIRTIDELRDRGIELRSLREGVDFSTSMGRMVAGIFAALAEYERELTRERAAAARAAAGARGVHTGRPRALTDEQAATALQMRDSGIDMPTIARTLGVSRTTVYRYTDALVAVRSA